MFLSKWQLERTADLARNPYEIHKLLWRAFPDREQDARPFLFRLEGRARWQNMLMQSTLPPSAIPAQRIRLLASKEVQPEFQPGQYLRFFVQVNPVKRLVEAKESQKKGKRVPLLDEDDQATWLQRQFQDTADLDWDYLRIEAKQNLFFRKHEQGGKIATVTFSGILQVKDSAGLRRLMETGIGPAKCFGCGLLSLARA